MTGLNLTPSQASCDVRKRGVCDLGQVYSKKGLQLATSRIKLLGVLYAGPVHRVDGTVEIVPVPAANQVVTRSTMPNNLGMVIKSRKLRELDELVKNKA